MPATNKSIINKAIELWLDGKISEGELWDRLLAIKLSLTQIRAIQRAAMARKLFLQGDHSVL